MFYCNITSLFYIFHFLLSSQQSHLLTSCTKGLKWLKLYIKAMDCQPLPSEQYILMSVRPRFVKQQRISRLDSSIIQQIREEWQILSMQLDPHLQNWCAPKVSKLGCGFPFCITLASHRLLPDWYRLDCPQSHWKSYVVCCWLGTEFPQSCSWKSCAISQNMCCSSPML